MNNIININSQMCHPVNDPVNLRLMNWISFSLALRHNTSPKERAEATLIHLNRWKLIPDKYSIPSARCEIQGPGNMPELIVVWFRIFQKPLNSYTITNLWNRTIITPVPKILCPCANRDFAPVALTSVVLKCLEKLTANMLKTDAAASLDPSRAGVLRTL